MKEFDPMRRCDIQRNTPEELAILKVMEMIEAMPADHRLTMVVSHLAYARNILANYVDGVGGEEAERPKFTLGEYLAENYKRTCDHSLRAEVDANGIVSFYIHPQNVNGDTRDFLVFGNVLKPKG